jgi:hypothetical protein
VRAAKAGLIVHEVPSIEQERIHGVSKLHPVRDGLRVLRVIFNERLHWSAPIRAADFGSSAPVGLSDAVAPSVGAVLQPLETASAISTTP